ncbi:conserved oligomeric Golgi complex subunit 3-like [Rhagoletis pomonella]|uniref:conserved oligomeric Golgi complex subunit 3-like n=1 Tax=Rhagoletis pomonella TaxID=28610 RepID=UPI0017863478|nr:conserved oligomeric Golgi complex subunit 3-like [Rhagoletis pomonella]
MDDVAVVQSENENLRKVRTRLLQWESSSDALAPLNALQLECLDVINNQCRTYNEVPEATSNAGYGEQSTTADKPHYDSTSITGSASAQELLRLPSPGINNSKDFLLWYDRVKEEITRHADAHHYQYLQQLEQRDAECGEISEQINSAMGQLKSLNSEYETVSQKTSALNTASEKLTEEQKRLQKLGDEIQRRLHYFSQVELLHQRLQSPTLSVASEAFRDCLDRIDECLEYLRANPKFKDAGAYTAKYKYCLSKAVTLIKNYTQVAMSQATAATLHPKQSHFAMLQSTTSTAIEGEKKANTITASTSPDAAFALYYGKYQTAAVKIKRVAQLVESRLERSVEYEQLLAEMHQNYLNERATIMSPAVNKAIQELKAAHKGDHCALTRSACSFLVHVCQDEQRLFFQFFARGSDQLTTYLEGLCTILYDTMRPFIIHINHLETLAEICSILRIEMLEEHVQQNPGALEAFANTANQLLQDVQERLVFRAHLYLQSDILNYNPSAGDLAYPDKLEMMESIALSLQEPQHMRRYDSRSSLNSSISSAIETESVDTAYRARNINSSPADLHGMWYPTVRRTLVCLSRLYRCVDRPIFQGLSQEALKLCIQSVSAAASKISTAKTPIDGELFEIKHLLILREQIAPFRVDFTIKETSLDFSKVKTAAFGLLHKRKQLFTMGSNNALLEFLLEGTPQIKEHLLDSRKEVDRQLKMVCEQFIKDAVHMLVSPILQFLDKAQALLQTKDSKVAANEKEAAAPKLNYALRQSAWASPQQISSIIQETQRLIKSKLSTLQRSMQLYLSNRDTEFIIFRPIRNNIIQTFVKLEQILTTNGYNNDDMTITGCPTAEQVSVLLSSASILATEGIVNFSAAARKISTSSNEETAIGVAAPRRTSFEKRVSFEGGATPVTTMENLPEMPESGSSAASPAPPLTVSDNNENEEGIAAKIAK